MPRATSFQMVQVLLAEYASLRNHIVARTTVSIQLIGIAFGSLALIVPQIEMHLMAGLTTLTVVAVAILCLTWIVYDDLLAECAQVRGLEARINGLAGEELLTWETRHGVVHGLVGPLRRRAPASSPRT